MNTADKSLSVIDFALRRRFEFQELVPEPQLCPASYGGINVQALITLWNNRITTLRSRDYRFGHAELMQVRLEAVRESNGWPATPDGQRRAFGWTLRRKLVPLLVEYFHEDWRKAQAILGVPELFSPHKPTDDAAYYEEVADVADATSFDLGVWSDPTSESFDGQRLLAALTKIAP